MSAPISIAIDGRPVDVPPGESVLGAARRLGIDIPTLCYLEKCGPLNTCQVCLVKINGKLVPSCGTKAAAGMVVESETTEVHEARRTALELLFSDHVGDCLSPCQRLCPLMLNIPVMLRQIQSGRLSEASATVRQALPLAGVLGRLCHHPCEQGCRRGQWDDPAAIRDMEKFVTDWERGQGGGNIEHRTPNTEHPSAAAIGVRGDLPHPDPLPLGEGTASALSGSPDGSSANADLRRSKLLEAGTILPLPAGEGRGEGEGSDGLRAASIKPSTGKSLVIIGAGPTGLAAAYYLTREGHVVTVVDRRARAGGTLLDQPEQQLPAVVLNAEVGLLARMGIDFKLGAELGNPLTLDGLARGFDAILLTVGELSKDEAVKLRLPFEGGGLKADPNTCQTPLAKVFAAGSCVRPQKQLIKAMAEGRAAAECVSRFLRGQPVRRPGKPFSSIMGRLDPAELKTFIRSAKSGGSVSPCDRCAGHSRQEAALESSRCLHCDCHSSGNCVLQHYAWIYGAEAGRFRSERRKFEQQLQPGGIIFEPGKCILCGICVKLCEMAAEPLGLAFVGRGFDVRVAAPFDEAIERGLQKVAEECVAQCPTGALVFAENRGGSAND